MAIPTHIGQRDPGDGTYNPGLQTNIPPVTRDNALYDTFITAITSADTLGSGTEKYQQDLFGRAPMSGLFGFWSTGAEITVTVSSTDEPTAPAITHTCSGLAANQVVVLPVLGFLARSNITTKCQIVITDGVNTFRKEVTLAALPPDDADGVTLNGFPKVQVMTTAGQDRVSDDLYFVILSERRANIAFDRLANVRWYVRAGDPGEDPACWLPVFNTVRLSDGTFIGSDDHLQYYYTPADLKENEPPGLRELWRFDATGRVHGIYFIRDRAHHSLIELPEENALLYASDYISARTAGEGPVTPANQGPSAEDCIAILDLETGYEKVYYDLRIIMNFWRLPVPTDLSVPFIYDWIHINQVYLDSDTNLLIASCRHQSAIIGIERDTGSLRFISAHHDNWEASESGIPVTDWSNLLLLPVNPASKESGNSTGSAHSCDDDFWTWGQHNVREIIKSTSNPDIIQFSVFNNGNYRTRDQSEGVVASANASRCSRYEIMLSQMEISLKEAYGESEIGPEGYSSYVSTAHFFNHNDDPAQPRLFANFGGIIFQDNGSGKDTGLPLTLMPGESDRQDPEEQVNGTYQGRVILQEVDLNSRTPVFEIRLTSGSFKSPGSGTLRRAELYCFRAYKMPLYS